MTTAAEDYEALAESGDPAAMVAAQTDQELRELCHHAEGLMRRNAKKGGWPAVVKWLCAIEAAKRFLSPPTHHA